MIGKQEQRHAMNTLAIDVGGTKFAMAVFADNEMIMRQTQPTDREGGRDWMLAQIVGRARLWQQQIELRRCGVGFGGPVHFAEQRVVLSTHVGGWENVRLSEFLQQQLGLPTITDNDANVGALGEGCFGAGSGYDPLLYLTISTGIGGGLVAGGRVYHGADSYAGEIGHLTIRPDGPECLCGARGCLERLCCGLWLERDYGRSAQELLQDPAFVERYVVDLAQGLKAAIMLLNPARVVIGGFQYID